MQRKSFQQENRYNGSRDWEVQKQLWFKEEYKDLASVQEERDENSTKSEIATTTRPYAQRGGGWD